MSEPAISRPEKTPGIFFKAPVRRLTADCSRFREETPSFSVRLAILGTLLHIGTRHDLQSAKRLYDSALFHLWGFLNNPKENFYFYREDAEDDSGDEPEFAPEVMKLFSKLTSSSAVEEASGRAFDYSQRKTQRPI